MSKADCSTSTLAEILRSRKDVDTVKVVSRSGAVFGFSTFPILLNQIDRGVIFRAENWFRVEEDLVKWMGSAGESIMFREGETYGLSTASRYTNANTTQDHAMLVQNVRDGGRAAGWGILEYKMSDDNTSIMSMKYPVTNAKGEVTSKFFHGMLTGILEVILNVKLRVLESAYNKDQSALRIKYGIDGDKPPFQNGD